MAVTLNASTSSGFIQTADTSGQLQLQANGATISTITSTGEAVTGNISATGTIAAATGTLYPLVSGTAVTLTTQTSVDFTSIPSWVKRITVMFSGVSTSGTSNWLLQIGDSGGIENTGYISQANTFNVTPSGAVSTAGYLLANSVQAASTFSGVIPVVNVSGNNWVTSGVISSNVTANGQSIFGGTKTLSDVLTQIRITTVNGTDTFDAGSINILYE